MALSIVPGRVVHERLAEEHLDLVVRPVLRRERLQEHDDALGSRQDIVKGPTKNYAPENPSAAASRSI